MLGCIIAHQISLQARCAPVGCPQLPRGRDHKASWLFEEMISISPAALSTAPCDSKVALYFATRRHLMGCQNHLEAFALGPGSCGWRWHRMSPGDLCGSHCPFYPAFCFPMVEGTVGLQLMRALAAQSSRPHRRLLVSRAFAPMEQPL